MKRRIGSVALAVWLAATGSLASAQSEEESSANVLFRYTNARGHLVVDQSIPPRSAAEGYEIITESGRVLKEVPPAPKGEDAVKYAEKLRREAELAEWDAYLKRRYSSVKDIASAKKRALSDLNGTLSILRSNLTAVKSQLEEQQRRAGVMERNGREVSETVLTNITNLEAEIVDVKRQIESREQELSERAAKFDRDIARFAEISQES